LKRKNVIDCFGPFVTHDSEAAFSGEKTVTKTKVLPPGEEQPLDCKLLAELVRKVIYQTLEDLRDLSLPQPLHGINRINDNGIGYYELASPDYRDPIVWERVNQIWRSEESTALTDYIWDRGAL
jgi:hypothetical protein